MASLSVTVSYARIGHDVDLDRLAAIVRAAGGHLSSRISVPDLGRLACAWGIDAGTLALLAAIAPTDPASPN